MSWHTKEDVLDDLTEVMGNEIKDLDEHYILIGEQPPPPICTSDEIDHDEIYLRLNEDKITNEDCKDPDLSGITKMLRMVDQYQCINTLENETNYLQNNESNDIIITKLNVDVQEFIPKNDKGDESMIEKGNKENNDANGKNVDNRTKTRLTTSEGAIDPAKVKEISEKLKTKIITPSKTTCLKMRSERNLAIASLLKLYSNAAPAPDEKPKLIKPEQFEGTGSSEPFIDNTSHNSQKKLISTGLSFQPNKVENAVEISIQDNGTEQEVKESVAKVNSWLNKDIVKQSVAKEPALYLGPVTFKKKEVKKTKTEDLSISDKSQNRIGGNSFIPSEYASQLTQSYMNRVKAKEDKSLDLWGKLEMELKEKDKEIIAKRHEEPSSVEVPQ